MLKIGTVYQWDYPNYTFRTSKNEIIHMMTGTIVTVLGCQKLGQDHKPYYPEWELKYFVNEQIITIFLDHRDFFKFVEVC